MDNHFFKRKYTSIIFTGSFVRAWQTFLTKQKKNSNRRITHKMLHQQLFWQASGLCCSSKGKNKDVTSKFKWKQWNMLLKISDHKQSYFCKLKRNEQLWQSLPRYFTDTHFFFFQKYLETLQDIQISELNTHRFIHLEDQTSSISSLSCLVFFFHCLLADALN